ncbi:MAG: cyclic pyranopterin monophosphate synthase MoaC [Thermoplasmata archaeon]
MDKERKDINVERSKDIHIVDISSKEVVSRISIAEGKIVLKKSTIKLIKKGEIKKGDVLAVAQIAAIQAVKHTWEIIPLCHNIPIEGVEVNFKVNNDSIRVICKVRSTYKTGVEMEALSGVSAALLAIWDMTKYLEKDRYGKYTNTKIENNRLIEKIKTNKN